MNRSDDLPQYHIRPARGWLNDPNGLCRVDGRWHVFYQHNPKEPVHTLIHWGHASSTDLVSWQEHPVAFGPTPGGPDAYGCWSGVYVSGLDRPAVVYSGIADSTQQSTVCLRWGSADLDDWGAPVVVAETPQDAGVAIMRDPFVFTAGGRRWALLGSGLTTGDPALLLYSCDDILAWRYVGNFLTHTSAAPWLRDAAPGSIWECPQLVVEGDRAAVILSLWENDTLGDVVAVTGSFGVEDGLPIFGPEASELLDAGSHCYAPQVMVDEDGPLLLGWIREDDITDGVRPVAGCLTLPRRLTIRGPGVRMYLDPRIGAAATGPRRSLSAGEHVLPAQALVEARGEGVRVRGHTADVLLGPGDTAWVDATVLETYRADGAAPLTHRDAGPWRVVVSDRAPADVTALALPTMAPHPEARAAGHLG